MIAGMPRYAAIDIGSNSVRMQAAEVNPGSAMRVLATDREVTRLGASVFRQGRISDEAADFVCQVLKRMAQAYASLDVSGVRAVATSAVRDASNQAEFLARAYRGGRFPGGGHLRTRRGAAASIWVCKRDGLIQRMHPHHRRRGRQR